MRKVIALVATLSISVLGGGTTYSQSGQGDPHVLGLKQAVNQQLQTSGVRMAVERIEFFTIGEGRPSNRIHQSGEHWVAGDPRRLADGDNITYLVDQSDGATLSGLTSAQTETAIDRAFETWQAEGAFKR